MRNLESVGSDFLNFNEYELFNSFFLEILFILYFSYLGMFCSSIVLTKSMRRLDFLVKCCYKLREPVLLVGETGGGKTTVCQLLSRELGSTLHILNCHQYTETSDFIGVVLYSLSTFVT